MKKDNVIKDQQTDKSYTKEPSKVSSYDRRDFIKSLGLTTGAVAVGTTLLRAGTPKNNIPIDYKPPANEYLTPELIKSLYERGQPEIYKGDERAYVGMPIGGVTAGQVYMGGDGKLWLWNIFNEQHNGVVDKTNNFDGRRIGARDGSNFVVPIAPDSPFEQGFSIDLEHNGKKITKSLDDKGFTDISFKGQYPVAEVAYRDNELPLTIDLQAFSPFIPLDFKSSNFPATVLRYTIKNVSQKTVKGSLNGWLENAVLHDNGDVKKTKRRNRFILQGRHAMLVMDAPVELATNKGVGNHPTELNDYGSMCLTLRNSTANDLVSVGGAPLKTMGNSNKEEVVKLRKHQIIGSLAKAFELAPQEEVTVEFVISWYYTNLFPAERWGYYPKYSGRYYKNIYADASEVAEAINNDFESLHTKTVLWRDTYYNKSTLPHWFLNRTFINTSILATETCYLLEDGRFWAWEGVGCCPGTCTHVWHYGQAMGRIFPELEQNLREETDFKVIDKETGKIDFRGGLAKRDAADGQAGIIMRSYRQHLTSSDGKFLKDNWSHIKLALSYLIKMDKKDKQADGMIFGEQHNTLDAEWYGNIPVITSLYLCALACGNEMAQEVKDTDFADECQTILDKGKKNIETLFNAEYGYFVQNEDPGKKNAIGIGTGCYIDQVFGQSWAFQVGLGRLFNADMNKSSLNALWKHNFVPDMGPFRASKPKNLAGRMYALEGDAGLVMCTWPNGGRKSDWEKHWQYGYFNECMTGFEYEVASQMVWEGGDLLDKGMAVTKAIHDRYSPLKRNPYNEIECSDHYARAMASYGVYIAACGFEYHGPKGFMAIAPRWQKEDFEAAFTAADGWGSYSQKLKGNSFKACVDLAYGKLTLNELAVEIPGNVKNCVAKLNGKKIEATIKQIENKLTIILNNQLLNTGDKLDINVAII
jgi:uncharacterized protein (DUF608 family)